VAASTTKKPKTTFSRFTRPPAPSSPALDLACPDAESPGQSAVDRFRRHDDPPYATRRPLDEPGGVPVRRVCR
jgi:hypothetical protein